MDAGDEKGSIRKIKPSNGGRAVSFEFSGGETRTGTPLTLSIGLTNYDVGFIAILRGYPSEDNSEISILNIQIESEQRYLPRTQGEFRPQEFKRAKGVEGYRRYVIDSSGYVTFEGGKTVQAHASSIATSINSEIEIDDLIRTLHENRKVLAYVLNHLQLNKELSRDQVMKIAQVPQLFLDEFRRGVESRRQSNDSQQTFEGMSKETNESSATEVLTREGFSAEQMKAAKDEITRLLEAIDIKVDVDLVPLIEPFSRGR